MTRGNGGMRGGDAGRSEMAAKGKWEVGGGGCTPRGRGALRGWRLKRQGHTKRISGRGNATTSRTRSTGGDGATRGDGAMEGGDARRWEVAA